MIMPCAVQQKKKKKFMDFVISSLKKLDKMAMRTSKEYSSIFVEEFLLNYYGESYMGGVLKMMIGIGNYPIQ